MTIYMAVYAYMDLYQNYLFSQNKIYQSGKSLFFQCLFSFIFFALVIETTSRLTLAILIMVVVNCLVGYIFSVKACSKDVQIIIGKQWKKKVKSLLHETMPLFTSLLLMNIMTNETKYIMDMTQTKECVGVYNALFIIFAAINLLSGFIYKPLLSQYSILLEENRIIEYKKKIRRQILLIVGLTIVIVIFMWLFGTELLSIVYNTSLNSYKHAVITVCVGGGEIAVAALFYYQLVIM